MLAALLSGGEVTAATTTRAQLPLLLNQAVVVISTAVDIAVETDTAFDATVFIGAALIPVDIAVETDTAFNVTVDNPPGTIFLAADRADEADTAFDLTVSVTTPAAYPGVTYPSSTTYPWSGDYQAVDIAVETDTAFDVDSPVFDFLFPVSATSSPSLDPVSGDGNMLTPVDPV